MGNEFFEEDKNLSESETLIMKTIWDIGGDVPLGRLIEELNASGKKDYARTTIATFLTKLSAKGFVKSYRVGRVSFIRILKSEAEYRSKLMTEQMNFWFEGNKKKMIAALCDLNGEKDSTIGKIKGILDDLDD